MKEILQQRINLLQVGDKIWCNFINQKQFYTTIDEIHKDYIVFYNNDKTIGIRIHKSILQLSNYSQEGIVTELGFDGMLSCKVKNEKHNNIEWLIYE